MIRPDQWIKRMALEQKMIEPFQESQIRTGISFGLSSYGYDMRISDEFKIFVPKPGMAIDPKNSDPALFHDVRTPVCEIPPHSFILGRTVEYFRIPRNVITVCYGKSTYARSGVFVNVTPFEPEWEGFATVQVFNTTPVPVRVYANEGIAQILFFESDEACLVSYKDKKGKYQAQTKITVSKI
ncbi:MAG TPA: dCTP deaminase [Candidatus Omnitrophota bacterium]|nr:dCTP deaminase [Candidatus Omnitrophota bacterium]